MSGNGEEVKFQIVRVLEENRDGLSIQDISDKINVHRHTVSKYILYLEGADEIAVRKIGNISLIYLKKNFPASKGSSASLFVLLVAFGLTLSMLAVGAMFGGFQLASVQFAGAQSDVGEDLNRIDVPEGFADAEMEFYLPQVDTRSMRDTARAVLERDLPPGVSSNFSARQPLAWYKFHYDASDRVLDPLFYTEAREPTWLDVILQAFGFYTPREEVLAEKIEENAVAQVPDAALPEPGTVEQPNVVEEEPAAQPCFEEAFVERQVAVQDGETTANASSENETSSVDEPAASAGNVTETVLERIEIPCSGATQTVDGNGTVEENVTAEENASSEESFVPQTPENVSVDAVQTPVEEAMNETVEDDAAADETVDGTSAENVTAEPETEIILNETLPEGTSSNETASDDAPTNGTSADDTDSNVTFGNITETNATSANEAPANGTATDGTPDYDFTAPNGTGAENATDIANATEASEVSANESVGVVPRRDADKVVEEFREVVEEEGGLASERVRAEIIRAIEDLTPVDVQSVETSYDGDGFEAVVTVRSKVGTTVRIVDFSDSIGEVRFYRNQVDDGHLLFTTHDTPVEKVFLDEGDRMIMRGDVKHLPIEFFVQIGLEVIYFKSLPFVVEPIEEYSDLDGIFIGQHGSKFDVGFNYPVGSINFLGSVVSGSLDLSGLATEYREELVSVNGTDYRSVVVGLQSDVTQRFAYYDRIAVRRPGVGNILVCHEYDFPRGICSGVWEGVEDPENIRLSAFAFIAFLENATVDESLNLTIDIERGAFERRFFCDGCSEGAVPEGTEVGVLVKLDNVDSEREYAYTEYVPSNWTIVDSGGGNVTEFNGSFTSISWSLGDVNGSLFANYTAVAPQESESTFFSQVEDLQIDAVNVTAYEPEVSPNITSLSDSFLLTESPTFDLEFTDLEERNTTELLQEIEAEIVQDVSGAVLEQNGTDEVAIDAVVSTESSVGDWTGSNETISVEIFGPSGESLNVSNETVIEKLDDGRFRLEVPSDRDFQPGVYSMETTLEKDGETFVLQEQFGWGLVSMNTRKSTYRPGETAEMIFVVLDRHGHPVCSSDITAYLHAPDNGTFVFGTSDGGIAPDAECGLYNAAFIPNLEGNYSLDVSALTDGINASFSTFFAVQEEFAYDIVRGAQSKVDPVTKPNDFEVSINISSLVGPGNVTIVEYVPGSFNVSTDGSVSESEGTKSIRWEVSPDGTQPSEVRYSYSIPKVFPRLYALGRVEVVVNNSVVFQEARNWFVAADPNVTVSGNSLCEINNGTLFPGSLCSSTSAEDGVFWEVEGQPNMQYSNFTMVNVTANSNGGFATAVNTNRPENYSAASVMDATSTQFTGPAATRIGGVSPDGDGAYMHLTFTASATSDNNHARVGVLQNQLNMTDTFYGIRGCGIGGNGTSCILNFSARGNTTHNSLTEINTSWAFVGIATPTKNISYIIPMFAGGRQIRSTENNTAAGRCYITVNTTIHTTAQWQNASRNVTDDFYTRCGFTGIENITNITVGIYHNTLTTAGGDTNAANFDGIFLYNQSAAFQEVNNVSVNLTSAAFAGNAYSESMTVNTTFRFNVTDANAMWHNDIFNFTTGRWNNLENGTLSTSATQSVIVLNGNLTGYVNATDNTVKTRLWTSLNVTSSFRLQVDHFNLTILPGDSPSFTGAGVTSVGGLPQTVFYPGDTVVFFANWTRGSSYLANWTFGSNLTGSFANDTSVLFNATNSSVLNNANFTDPVGNATTNAGNGTGGWANQTRFQTPANGWVQNNWAADRFGLSDPNGRFLNLTFQATGVGNNWGCAGINQSFYLNSSAVPPNLDSMKLQFNYSIHNGTARNISGNASLWNSSTALGGAPNNATLIWNLSSLANQSNVGVEQYVNVSPTNFTGAQTYIVQFEFCAGLNKIGGANKSYVNISLDNVQLIMRYNATWSNRSYAVQPSDAGKSFSGYFSAMDGYRFYNQTGYLNFSVAVPPVCNNNTGTCYTTVQSAIDAASPEDVIVITDSGNYNESLVVNVAGLTITTNTTPSPTIVSAVNNTPAINITSGNVTVRNVIVVQNVTGSTAPAIESRNVGNVTIVNNTISTNAGQSSGIFGMALENSTIANNIITTNGSFGRNIGINLTTLSIGNNVTFNTISTKGISSNNYGVYLTSSSNNIVSNNTMYTNGTSNNYGIFLFISATSNIISFNTISTFGTSSNEGILISSSSNNNTVSYNNISTNGTSSSNNGIALSTSSNTTITGNNISTKGANSNSGIELSSNSYFNNITRNKISTSGTGSGNYGIELLSGTDNKNILSSNNISTNGTSTNHGIYILSSSNTTITGNNISTSGTSGVNNGILLFNSSNNTVSYNNISTNGTGNQNYGVYLSYLSSGNNVTDSVVYAPSSADAYDNTTGSSTNYLVNVTFNKTDISFNSSSDGRIFVQYYLDLRVLNATSVPMFPVNVTVNDTDSVSNVENPTSNASLQTNSSGHVARQTLTEFLANLTYNSSTGGTGYLYFTNYTVAASAAGNVTNSTIFNITASTASNLTLYPIVPTPVCNNNTGACYTTVQNAINAATPEQVIVISDAGHYSESLVVNVTGLTLTTNASSSPTIISSASDTPTINITSGNVTVRNIVIVQNVTGSTAPAVEARNVGNVTIVNNTIFTNASQSSGIFGMVLGNSTLSNNMIATNGTSDSNVGINITVGSNANNLTSNVISTSGDRNNHGVFLSTSSSNNLTGNNVSTNGASDSNIGIYIVTSSSLNKVSNNIVSTNGTDSNYGIFLASSSTNNIVGLNNITTSGTSLLNTGIRIVTGSSRNIFSNNTVSTRGTSSNYGMYMLTSSSNNLTGNNISTNGTSSSNYGIYFDTSSNNNITSNVISTFGTSGNTAILLLFTSSNNTVSNNTIFTNGTSNNNIGLVTITGTSNNLYSNNISTNGTSINYGIYASATRSSTIQGNRIYASGVGDNNLGIFLDTRVNNTILHSNNISTNGTNGNYGIYMVASSNNNNISYNNISTNGTNSSHGIYLSSSSIINISYNNISTNGTYDNYGIYLGASSSNNITTNTIYTKDTSGTNYGVYLTSTSTNNTLLDSIIIAPSSPDVRDDTSGSRSNYLVNVTFNKSDISFLGTSSGDIIVQYYLDLRVLNSIGSPMFPVNVTVNDTDSVSNVENPTSNASLQTNSSGHVARQTLTEFLANLTYNSSTGGTGYLYFTNYTVVASTAGNTTSSTAVNLTASTSLISILYNLYSFQQSDEIRVAETSSASLSLSGVGSEVLSVIDSVDTLFTGVRSINEPVSLTDSVDVSIFRLPAVCNRDTGLCYDTIQAAINAASSGQTVVITNSSEYNESVVVNVTGLTLTTNASSRPTMVSAVNNTPTINITSGNVTVRNIAIVQNVTGSTAPAVEARNVGNVTIVNNTIFTKAGKSSGIFGRVLGNSTLSNNTINTNGTSFGNSGINLTLISKKNIIEFNNISTKGTTDNYGIYLESSSNSTVTGNNISTNGTSFINLGIYLFSGSNSNNITQNKISTYGTSSNFGIQIFSNSNFNNITQNNVFTQGTSGANYGIYLTSSSSFNDITQNNISTGGNGGNNDGIQIGTNSNSNNVTQNRVSTSGTSNNVGIHFISSSNSNILEANNISTNGTSIRNYGIFFSIISNSTVTGNNISTNGASTNVGVYLFSGSNSTFTGNNISTNGSGNENHGVYFSILSSNNNVTDSIISAPSSADVYDNTTGSATNYLINVTFNKSDISFNSSSDGRIFVQYYLDLRVLNSIGSPMFPVNVTVNDTDSVSNVENPTSNASLQTNSSGHVARQTLTEFLANLTYNSSTGGTGYLYFTNYTVNASASGNVTDSTKLNMTESAVVNLTLYPIVNPAVCNNNTGVCYNTIQAAINNASSYQTIVITNSSEYNESVVVNVTGLTLTTNSSPLIFSQNISSTVTVSSNNVTVSGLHISYNGSFSNANGISASSRTNLTVADNRINNSGIVSGNGMFLSGTVRSNVRNNTILTSGGNNNNGIWLSTSHYNNFTGNVINSSGASSDFGFRLDTSSGNLFVSNNVTVISTSNGYGLRFAGSGTGSTNNSLIDSIISVRSASDMRDDNTVAAQNFIINSTFQKNETSFGSDSLGKFFVQYYLDLRVLNATGTPMFPVNVTVNDTDSVSNVENPTSNASLQTNSSGHVARQTLTEFLANLTYNSSTGGTGYLYFTNYTVVASAAGNTTSSASVNLTASAASNSTLYGAYLLQQDQFISLFDLQSKNNLLDIMSAQSVSISDFLYNSFGLERVSVNLMSVLDGLSRTLGVTRGSIEAYFLSDYSSLLKSMRFSVSEVLFEFDVSSLIYSFQLSVSQALSASDLSSYIVSLQRSATQSLSLSDAAQMVKSMQLAVSESFSFLNLSSLIYSFQLSVSESFDFFDLSSRISVVVKPVFEAMGLTQLSQSAYSLIQSSFELLSAVDYSRSFGDVARSLYERLSLADASSFVKSVQLTVSQTLSLYDLSSSIYAFQKSVSESILESDLSRLINDVQKSLYESVSFSNLASLTKSVQKSVSESLSALDISAIAKGLQSFVYQQMSLIDASSFSKLLDLRVLQTVSLSDAISLLQGSIKEFFEFVGLSDVSASALNVQRSFTEVLSSADVSQITKYLRLSLSEILSELDLSSLGKVFQSSISESMSFLDLSSIAKDVQRSLSEPLALSNLSSPILSLQKFVSDSLSAVDASAVFQDFRRSLSESFALSDLSAYASALQRSFTESLRVSDLGGRTASVSLYLSEILRTGDASSVLKAMQLRLSEAFSFSDLSSLGKVFQNSVSEQLSALDLSAISKNLQEVMSQSLSFSDLSSPLLSLQRSFSESFGLAEFASFTKSVQKSVSEAVLSSDVGSAVKSLQLSVSQRLSELDLSSLSKYFERALSVSASLSDLSAYTKSLRLSVYESLSESDVSVLFQNFQRGVSQTMQSVNLSSFTKSVQKSVSQALSLSDIGKGVKNITDYISELLRVDDAISIRKVIQIRISEAFSFLNLSSLNDVLQRSFSETLRMADASRLAKDMRLSVSQVLSEFDLSSLRLQVQRSVSNLMSEFDMSIIFQNFQRGVSNIVSATTYQEIERDFNRFVTQLLTARDAQSFRKSVSVAISEALNLDDLNGIRLNISLRFSQALSLVDQSIIFRNYAVSVYETFGFSDAVSLSDIVQVIIDAINDIISGGGGGGGGTGAVPTSLPELPVGEGSIRIVKAPVVLSAQPGGTSIANVVVENNDPERTSSMRIEVEGVPDGWLSVAPTEMSLAPGATDSYIVLISVPADAVMDDYKVSVTVSDGKSADRASFFLRVGRASDFGRTAGDLKSESRDRPTFSRTVDVDRDRNETEVKIHLFSARKSYKQIQLVETIDKAIAETTDEITFDPRMKPVILERDPKVLYTFNDVKAGDEITVTYTVRGVVEDIEKLVYWTFDRVTFVERDPPRGFQSTEVSEAVFVQGVPNWFALKVKNLDSGSHVLVTDLDLPDGWNHTPENVTFEFGPLEERSSGFEVTVPPSAAAGKYVMSVVYRWDGTAVVKEVVVTIDPLSKILTVAIIIAVSAGAAIGIAIWIRRRRTGTLEAVARRKLDEMRGSIDGGRA